MKRSCFLTIELMLCLVLGCGGCHSGESDDMEDSLTPLAAYQIELLDIAFSAASAMPLDPHIKNRSRAQAQVVTTCLTLQQPRQARVYIESIADWRQGVAYAELAQYGIQNGLVKEVNADIERAKQAAEETEDWRRDRIRVKIAQAYTLLGQSSVAQIMAAGAVESEAGKLAAMEASLCGEASFEAMVESLDAVLATGNFDGTKNVLIAYTQLFKRFYADVPRRDRVEKKITESWDLMPIFVRVELLAEMAEMARDHKDHRKALVLVDQATEMMQENEWDLEHGLPRQARLLALRFQAGDSDGAKVAAEAAFTRYQAKRETVGAIFRAETLRPLAEAYQVMGQTEQAHLLYRQVVEEGMENPNSRPRAEDLSATCCSMAQYSHEPDSTLWARIIEIEQGLGDPW